MQSAHTLVCCLLFPLSSWLLNISSWKVGIFVNQFSRIETKVFPIVLQYHFLFHTTFFYSLSHQAPYKAKNLCRNLIQHTSLHCLSRLADPCVPLHLLSKWHTNLATSLQTPSSYRNQSYITPIMTQMWTQLHKHSPVLILHLNKLMAMLYSPSDFQNTNLPTPSLAVSYLSVSYLASITVFIILPLLL